MSGQTFFDELDALVDDIAEVFEVVLFAQAETPGPDAFLETHEVPLDGVNRATKLERKYHAHPNSQRHCQQYREEERDKDQPVHLRQQFRSIHGRALVVDPEPDERDLKVEKKYRQGDEQSPQGHFQLQIFANEFPTSIIGEFLRPSVRIRHWIRTLIPLLLVGGATGYSGQRP